MFVVFDGLDKSGKGTLELELLKATNFKHIVIDRGPAGYMVFDKLFNRQTHSGNFQFMKQAEFMMSSNNFMIVYCKVPHEVAFERIKEHGESCPYKYKYAQELYDLHVGALYDEEKVIEIDTHQFTVDECVNQIVNKLNKLQEVLKGEHN